LINNLEWGIGDVPRRIIAKSILYAVGDDVVLAAGPLQTCAGQSADSEAAVHAMKATFDDNACEAALLVDATDAFNYVNREAALHNISILCLALSIILNNTYMHSLFVSLLWVRVKYHHVRGQSRVTPSPWQCMPWWWFL